MDKLQEALELLAVLDDKTPDKVYAKLMFYGDGSGRVFFDKDDVLFGFNNLDEAISKLKKEVAK